jgi:hypothetical protein
LLIGAAGIGIVICVVVLVLWRPSGSPVSETTSDPPGRFTTLPPVSGGAALPESLSGALAEAKALAAAGDAKAALKKARDAARENDHPAAWNAMGQYACQAGKLKSANEALEHLGGDSVIARSARADLVFECRQKGMSLGPDGRFTLPK